MDQQTATIVAAIIGLSGAVTAAAIGLHKSGSPHHHTVEYRLHLADDQPWIQTDALLARIVRGIGWVINFGLIFVGINSLFLAGNLWLSFTDEPVRFWKTWALMSTGALTLLIALLISKKISLPDATQNDEDD